jgi:hypothetical protein
MKNEIEKFYARRQEIADEIALEEKMKLIVEGDRLRKMEEKIKKDNLKELDEETLAAVAEEMDISAVIGTYNPFISQECYNFVRILKCDCENAACKVKNVFFELMKNAIEINDVSPAQFTLEKYLEAQNTLEAAKWKPEHFKN